MVQQHQQSGNKVVGFNSKAKEKEAVRPHVKGSLEDINWVRSQPPHVQQLWLDCVAAEQFSGQQRELKTGLSKNFLPKAKAALEARGLFKFERVFTMSKAGRAVAVGWKVENLHGYYNKQYWELSSPCFRDDISLKQGPHLPVSGTSSPSNRDLISLKQGEETAETLTGNDVENAQPRLNQYSTTHQPPTKVVGEVVVHINIPREETNEPLEGAHSEERGNLEKAEKDSLSLNHGHVPPAALRGGFRANSTTEPEADASEPPLAPLIEKPKLLVKAEHSGKGQLSAAAADHLEKVDKLCKDAAALGCQCTDHKRQFLMEFSLEQLEMVSKLFQGRSETHQLSFQDAIVEVRELSLAPLPKNQLQPKSADKSIFAEWYKHARAQGIVTGKEERDGVFMIRQSCGTWSAFEEFSAKWTLEYLQLRSKR